MTVEEFAGFWSRQGCQTARGAGTLWYAVHPLVLLSLPYDRVIQPTRLDLFKMFSHTPALVLRYPTKASNAIGTGGLFVCDRRGYDLNVLHPKARNQTRKALHECTIQRLDFGALSEPGHELNEQTWHRQGRASTTFSRKHWQRYCQAAAHTPNMEAWAVFVEGRLAAFAVCALVERCYNILHQSSSSELLSHCPNNALAFAVTKGALEQTRVDFVSYGLKSVENTCGLEHFKLGMGFSILPFEERFVLHPLLRVCLALGGRLGVERAAARRPDSDFWRKALAICRMQNSRTGSVS